MNSQMFGTFLQPILAQTSLGDGKSTITTTADAVQSLSSIAIVVGAVLIPFLLSRLFARQLKMPAHAPSFFWILLAGLSTLFILATGKLKYGPDIVGGTNFIYEISRESDESRAGRKIVAKDFQVPLALRLNPSGTKEYLIRPIGEDQIEITIPDVDPSEIENIKRMISDTGNLEFRIVANSRDHQNLIDAAVTQSNSTSQDVRLKRDVYIVDKTTNEPKLVGVWRTLGRTETSDAVREFDGYRSGDTIRNSLTGQMITPPIFQGKKKLEFEEWIAKQQIKDVDVLLALEKFGVPYTSISGADLKSVGKQYKGNEGFSVDFTMTVGGAQKMLQLTGANLPSGQFKRRMAILLDKKVRSAPDLNSTIQGQGQITGNFTEKEVDYLVKILNAGSLPGALIKEPISQHSIGASMGQDAILKSTYASVASLIVTIALVLIYYRFSGIIATIALLLNLGMIMGSMVLIKQPLTLSGMAGLVLSVGMSVDANVLVFERIREETEKKATPRMAIRNGFDRAWTTIFDSNLTTLITAVVLYFVGTEQIKGFAITLIIGLVISLFTAVFVTHKLFEIADKWKFAWLGMSDYVNSGKRALFGTEDINFMSYRFMAYTGSLLLIVIGLVATGARGKQVLDIDFNGGTSIVFSLDKGLSPDKVREIVNQAFDKDERDLPIQTSMTTVQMNDFERDSVYKLDVSLNDSKEVTARLVKGFSGDSPVRLITFDLDVKKASNQQSRLLSKDSSVKLVSFQGSEATAAAPTSVPPMEISGPKTSIEIQFKNSKGQGSTRLNARQVSQELIDAAESLNLTLVNAQLELLPIEKENEKVEGWNLEAGNGFSGWNVTLPFDEATTTKVTDALRLDLQTQPVFQSLSKIESRVASEMQQRAIGGLLLSLVFIVAYIWFRFQRIAYGIAAVVALVHDVLITLAFIAVSHWLFQPFGFMLIEDFKISLTTIAGFLTIIGYSLNDTIVVFDRIREVKGKSPNLTETMINASVTQTLSRTLLTSSTTIIAILLMYIFGGEGIHGFAYCLLIGIVVGTYSSIFIAAPILLWFVQREQAKKLAAKVTTSK
jgi:SecD/SecF fusion protein